MSDLGSLPLLIADIEAYITTNGTQAITGAILQQRLKNISDTLDALITAYAAPAVHTHTMSQVSDMTTWSRTFNAASSGSTAAGIMGATSLGYNVFSSASQLAARTFLGLETVSQAEAEAGTATTERAWTAQRVAQAIAALGGGGGVTDFTDLGDVPSSYSGEALKAVRVNAGETALEFFTVSAGGDVVGPASATDDTFAKYDGTTGKLLKDGVLGSNGGNGASDGGKVVLFKSTGALEGRCTISFGVKGSTTSGTAIVGEADTGSAVGGTNAGTSPVFIAVASGSGDMFRGTNGSLDTFEVLNDGTLDWSNATAKSNTRTNLGLGALATLAAVDTAQITDGAVTESKLDDDAVATAKIADEAVTFVKLAPAAVVTEAEGIAANDNDTTIPTSAAVKAYADSVAGSSTDQIDFFIPVPINGTVTLRLNAKYAFTVDDLSIKTTSGTITAALQIDGVNVTSISAVAVTSTEQTATATGANSAATGTTLNLVLTSNSSAANLSGSIQITRT